MNQVLYKNPTMFLVPLLFSPSWFSEPFWKLLGERHLCPALCSASLHSKLHQRPLKLTPKGLNYYIQIGTLPGPCIAILWFWEVLWQSQSWLRTMQTDLRKLHDINSCIFELTTACPKIKSCACAKTWLCSANMVRNKSLI